MSISLDAVLMKESTFGLQVSMDDSIPSSQKAKKEVKPSTLGPEPLSKPYIVDLQGLRDNAPNSGDTLKLDEILDMIFPDVKRTRSNNPSADPDGLTSFEVQVIDSSL